MLQFERNEAPYIQGKIWGLTSDEKTYNLHLRKFVRTNEDRWTPTTEGTTLGGWEGFKDLIGCMEGAFLHTRKFKDQDELDFVYDIAEGIVHLAVSIRIFRAYRPKACLIVHILLPLAGLRNARYSNAD